MYNKGIKQMASPTAEHIQCDIYVDSLITGAQTVREALQLHSEEKQMFSEASMNL